jgi:hypothetical protein
MFSKPEVLIFICKPLLLLFVERLCVPSQLVGEYDIPSIRAVGAPIAPRSAVGFEVSITLLSPKCANVVCAFKVEKHKVNTKSSRNFFISNTLLVIAAKTTLEDYTIFKKRQVGRFNLLLNFAINLEHIKA